MWKLNSSTELPNQTFTYGSSFEVWIADFALGQFLLKVDGKE